MDHILLIERDPFVRTDMVQALESGFPEYEIHHHATLDEFEPKAVPRLLLIDIPTTEMVKHLTLRGWEDQHIICVLTGAGGQEEPGAFYSVSRPFTDDMLLGVVRDALRHVSVDC